tara:strand:- start:337 stop:603 length:267 start_codon:yes stop_codon:yes gene_type:complete
MHTKFLKKFSRDLDKIKQPKDKKVILQLIQNIQKSNSLDDISNIKKLVGFSNAYRIRSGNIRLGVFVDGDTIEFARVAHRKNIYKIFP